ncbi:hypothetical protein CVD28_04760 [Bacillus sp. M6-12]|uniref:hypothetical protein n=1 Tax=Bacillus sp. M6-12 TaxID=2054166 RepID=UPI000C7870CC|nr:hypothetical protein [Bacillus sp. M6-12]PLS19727.1 hypothetical protein CVD28_04760 [Bacillus sp. M6-12]
MKKIRKKTATSSIIGLTLISSALVMTTDYAEAVGFGNGNGSENNRIIPTLVDQRTDTIIKYKFNPNYNSEQGDYYNRLGIEMNREEYWPENSSYPGGFIWYSIVPQKNPTLAQTDMGRMLENRQTIRGNGGDHLLPGTLNLKYGASNPWTGDYYGNNSGTKTIQYGTYKGKKYEWRFIGYNAEGTVVSNPYFPADAQSNALERVRTKAEAGQYWSGRDWVWEGWELPKSINTFGYANDSLNAHSKKVRWIKDIFFKDYPAFKDQGNAEYWANIFRPLTNPEEETGVWLGWHESGGIKWYVTLITAPPKQNNLRLVKYQIIDSNGRVVAEQTRNGTSYDAIQANDPVIRNPWIYKGETYTIKTWVKNMPDKVQNVQTKMTLDNNFAYDDKIGSGNWDYKYVDTADSPNENKLDSGDTAVYTSTYKVPESGKPQEYIEFHATVPEKFYDMGYNINTADDDASIILEIAPENIGVEFEGYYDLDRNAVDYVMPNNEMWVKYKVTKTAGTKPVDGADLKIQLTDTKTVTTNRTYEMEGAYDSKGRPIADGVLKKQGDYAFFWASITPRQPKLCTQGSILSKWAKQGLNNDPSDDVAKPDCLVNPDNIVVSNFVAKPETVWMAKNQNKKSVQYTVSYNLSNFNYDKKDKQIPVIYTIDGKLISGANEVISVDAMGTTKVSAILPAVNVGEGEHIIQVEANPKPRKYVELKRNPLGQETDPYTDNIGWDKVNVEKNRQDDFYCVVADKSNNWNTRFTITDSYGWSWTHCTDDGCHTHRETDYYYSYPTVSFYERQEIKNIFFRSKFTTDKQGGWVDLLNTKGTIKAGYGFELKVVSTYNTNTYNDTPKWWNDGWHHGWYARSVSPKYTAVDSSARLKITMPFTDDMGKPIAIVLNGNQTGHWSNTTTTYQLEPRTVISKPERKVYINENTKDGNYNVRIETEPFYGSYDKPYTREMLCDVKNVTIEVKGSYLDDVKTHVVQ